MNRYISGTRVRSIANFADVTEAAANPTVTEFKYRAGAGAVQTTTSPTNDSTGTFHFDIDTSGWTGPENLLYTLQWKGTGAVQAIGLDYFEVEPPAI